MKKNISGLLLFVFALFAVGTSAQTDESSGLIKTKDGYLLVSNERGNYYTMEIKGKTIKPNPNHPFWFTVDDKFLQVVNAEKAQFLNGSDGKGLDDKALLLAHFKWESDYVAETLGSQLKLNTNWLKLSNGMTALAWDYDMPHVADKQTAKRQLYLIIVNGSHVHGLNTVVEKDGEEKFLQQLLIDTMNTFKPSDKPLSLEKAREQVLKGN